MAGGSDPVPPGRRSLLVRGIPPGVTDDLLEMYLENPKFGGGDVESMRMEGDGQALVVFREHGVVESLLEYGTHKLKGTLLQISQPPVEEEPEEVEEEILDGQTDEDTGSETNVILVEGLKPSVDEEMLELFFENTKRSGGGDIQNIQMNAESGTALIWFKEAEVVPKVVDRSPLKFSGCEMTVRPYVEEAMVKVSGLDGRIEEEFLELFFENKRRSGGGDMKSVEIIQDWAILTFEEEMVANRVVDKGSFTLSGCQLKVERFHGLKPAHPPQENTPQGSGDATTVAGAEANIATQASGPGTKVAASTSETAKAGETVTIGGQSGDGSTSQTSTLVGVGAKQKTQPKGMAGAIATPFAGMSFGMGGPAETSTPFGAGAASERSTSGRLSETGAAGPGAIPKKMATPNDGYDPQSALRGALQRSLGGSMEEEIPPVFWGPNTEQNPGEGPFRCAPVRERPPYGVDEMGEEAVNFDGNSAQNDVEDPSSPDNQEGSSDDGSCDEMELRSCTVEVACVAKKTSEETVKMYFESRKKSSGGKVENISLNKETGTCIITFVDRETVGRVLRRNMHKLDGAKLKVTEMQAVFQNVKAECKGPLEPTRIYMHGLTEKITKDQLELTLEDITEGDVVDIKYGTIPGVAMVTFKAKIDYRHLQKSLSRKPIAGCMLSVSRVCKPASLQVFNIGKISQDGLTAYFENRKSGGSGEAEVKVQPEMDCAIVTFESCEIAENVAAKNKHTFEGRNLELSLFRPQLGIIPVNHDSSQPTVQMPTDTIVKDLDPNKLYFLRTVPEAKRHFEKEIVPKVRAFVDWKHKTEGELHLTCTLSREDKDVRKLARNWEDSVQQAVQLIFKAIHIEKRACLKKTWKDVCGEVRKLMNNTQGVITIERDHESTLYVVGKVGAVKKTYQEVEKICTEVEGRLDHIQEAVELKDFEVDIFQKCEKQKLENRYPKVKVNVKVNKNGGMVEVNGHPKDLLNIQRELYAFQKNVDKKTLHKTVGQIKVLKMLKRQSQEFNSSLERLEVFTKIEGTSIELCGKADDIDKYEYILKENIKEKNIDVDSTEEQTAFEDSLWEEFSNGAFRRYNGLIHLGLADDKTSVILAAPHSDFNGLLEDVKMHIEKNAIKEVFLDIDYVDIDLHRIRMVMRWMKEEISTVEKDFQQYGVKISAPEDSRVLISGTGMGLDPARQRVLALFKKIISDTYDVTAPGMPHYFTQQGKYFIQSVEEKHKVIIYFEDPNDLQENKLAARRGRPGAMLRTTNTELYQAGHSSGVVIKVIIGDMTSHKVDAIVNAANANLAHVGGLAKAIADKGGPIIKAECDKYVRLNGPVLEGTAMVSGAGKLPCKKIIHAVGPHWVDGRSGEEDILYDCVYSHILAIALKENLQSVAIPAISAGVFGFPVAASAGIIVEAIKDFLKGGTGAPGSLKEIHLLDNRQEGGRAFVAALNKHFKSTRPIPPAGTPAAFQPRPANLSGLQAGVAGGNQGNIGVYQTNEGIVVTVKTGSIATEQVELIFNTTAKDLNLNSGAISSSILLAAGPGIQAEVSQAHPGGLQTGGHALSSGGNIPGCRQIFNAVLCNWDGGQGGAQKLMRKVVTTSLEHASQSGYTSVALPAMGTGNLRFPPDVVAETMFNSVIEFSKNNPGTKVKDVRFVLYSKDQKSIDAFSDHLSNLPGSASASVGGTPGGATGSRRKVFRSPSNVIAQETPGGAVGGAPDPHEMAPVVADNIGGVQGGGGGEIQIGAISLQVVPGDITKETTDAIVNGTNSTLDITQGAVSQAIAKAAGIGLIKECLTTGRVDSDGIAVTGGWNLQVKKVIHLDVQGRSKKKDWKQGVSACLQAAQGAGMSSLSFPALGTGKLNISPSKMAVAMMEAIAEFSLRGSTTLTLVRVVIFQPEMMQTYLDQMMKANKPGSSIMGMITGPFRYVGSTIKGFFTSTGGNPLQSTNRPPIMEQGVPVIDKSTASLQFTILGITKPDIEEVKAEISKCCKEESEDVLVKGDEYSEIIKFLDQSQIIALESVGQQHGVRITVDHGQRVARIRLQGQAKDVYMVDGKVKEILHKMRADLMEQQEAVMLAQLVQWESEENSQFHPYPAEVNTKLEKAHSKRDKFVEWEEEDNGKVIKWKVNLKAMTESDGNVTKQVKRRVIAEKGSTFTVPSTWTTGSGAGVFDLVQLSPTDKEYQTVSKEFSKTCPRAIIKIERLQNKYLYRRYMVHKEDMDARNGTTKNEMRLWHGTASTSFNSINTNGFNRSYCGQHGTVYGQGVYFAVGAQYSTNYAPPDHNAHCMMYFVRVLTGQAAVGNRTMKTPPSKNDPKNPSLHYDTTVDQAGAPSMYVIYYDTQAYPEYIVTFQ